MTTIAYRDGTLAADSCVSMSDESAGDWKAHCIKIYQYPDMIVGLQGESTPGLIFLDWLRAKRGKAKLRDSLVSSMADFEGVVLTRKGLFTYDRWCRPELVTAPFYAVGSGVKAALGALHCGATAEKAVEIACRVDLYSALPVLSFHVDSLTE